MRFEWDPAKSAANRIKHGIDFSTTKDLWLDENRIEIHVPHPVENRHIIIGKLDNKHWTTVYTMRVALSGLFRRGVRGKRRRLYMTKQKLAKSTREFDKRFDNSEDIHELVDMSKATVIHHGKKVRITLDIAESLVNEIDDIRKEIGVDRGALIKIWLHERVKKEKTAAA